MLSFEVLFKNLYKIRREKRTFLRTFHFCEIQKNYSMNKKNSVKEN